MKDSSAILQNYLCTPDCPALPLPALPQGQHQLQHAEQGGRRALKAESGVLIEDFNYPYMDWAKLNIMQTSYFQVLFQRADAQEAQNRCNS